MPGGDETIAGGGNVVSKEDEPVDGDSGVTTEEDVGKVVIEEDETTADADRVVAEEDSNVIVPEEIEGVGEVLPEGRVSLSILSFFLAFHRASFFIRTSAPGLAMRMKHERFLKKKDQFI